MIQMVEMDAADQILADVAVVKNVGLLEFEICAKLFPNFEKEKIIF